MKVDVLKELPEKVYHTIWCDMLPYQKELYLKTLNASEANKLIGNQKKYFTFIYDLKKISNHPLLIRNFYDIDKLKEMAELIMKVFEKLFFIIYVMTKLFI